MRVLYKVFAYEAWKIIRIFEEGSELVKKRVYFEVVFEFGSNIF